MSEFTLCFPLSCNIDQVLDTMIEHKLTLTRPKDHSLWFSGISFEFWHSVQSANADLVQAFQEHFPLTTEQYKRIESHQSLLFLRGTIKNQDHFQSVQETLRVLLTTIASGVYFDHCGCAYASELWLSDFAENSLEGWVNPIFAKGSLWTLGLAAFQIPDFVVQCSDESNLESKQDFLVGLADALFLENHPIESGAIINDLDGKAHLVQQESKGLYPKGDDLYNSKGTLRLVQQSVPE